MEVPGRTSVISSGRCCAGETAVRHPAAAPAPERTHPSDLHHITGLLSEQLQAVRSAGVKVYSLRIMSMARGGLSAQLGSTVRFDPSSMLAAVGRSSQMRRPGFRLSAAGEKSSPKRASSNFPQRDICLPDTPKHLLQCLDPPLSRCHRTVSPLTKLLIG